MPAVQPRPDHPRREPSLVEAIPGDARPEGGGSEWQYEWSLGGRRLWRPSRWRIVRLVLVALGDVAAAAAGLAIALAVADGGVLLERWQHLLPLAVIVTMLSQGVAGSYAHPSEPGGYGRSALAGVLAAVAMMLFAAAYPPFGLSLTSAGLLGVALAALVPATHAAAEGALGWSQQRGLFRVPALVVAAGSDARRITAWLERHGYHGLEVVDVVALPRQSDDLDAATTVPLPDLGEEIERSGARAVLVPRDVDEEAFRAVAYHCFLHGAELRVVPTWRGKLPFRMVDQDGHGMAKVELAVPHLRPVERLVKRTLDLLLAGTGLLLLAPLLAGIAVAVRLDSAGPVLFRQERLGRGGRRFGLLKFRTMEPDAEERLAADPELRERYVQHDYKLPLDEDPRVTRVGGFLRSTSLDELPQLVNVLKGDMSLVGPRPVVPPEIDEFGRHAPVVLGVRPGVTGYWQISGRSSVGYPERARREIAYVEKWSLWRDLVILARTVPVVLRKMGVV